ncbi:Protein CBG26615 [Caenorhabditis briggsae]|uniref:Protein CBG26615 n=1 Tax=Caenorhabditis briggsae TaxID=6238 RepID=B6IL95_CAEBR|nr:Protein CBG26615 [Caenorhabditis briggsae]CAS00675.1 Protein CBG26615 [Caenorhabditis briggsae]
MDRPATTIYKYDHGFVLLEDLEDWYKRGLLNMNERVTIYNGKQKTSHRISTWILMYGYEYPFRQYKELLYESGASDVEDNEPTTVTKTPAPPPKYNWDHKDTPSDLPVYDWNAPTRFVTDDDKNEYQGPPGLKKWQPSGPPGVPLHRTTLHGPPGLFNGPPGLRIPAPPGLNFANTQKNENLAPPTFHRFG